MNQQRTRRWLLVAFALSLVIHAILAVNVRWHLGSIENSVERVSVVHVVRIAHVVPVPHTPPPKPPKAAPAIKAPKTISSRPSGRGTAVTAVTPAPTHAPTPAPSPTANCMTADTQAAILATPPPPEIPPNARGDAASGTTHVRVNLDSKGAITGTSIVLSSGNASLDLIAETMARAAQYAPATHACKGIAGTYDFTAKFIAW